MTEGEYGRQAINIYSYFLFTTANQGAKKGNRTPLIKHLASMPASMNTLQIIVLDSKTPVSQIYVEREKSENFAF